MQLNGIFVYPIKGMGGIALQSASLEERGIYLDRRWMLIDEQQRFISQRDFSKLGLFQLKIAADHLKVSWKNEEISIPFSEESYPGKAKVTVWNDTIDAALVATDQLNNWFSQRIGITCRLVYQGEKTIRMTSPKYPPAQEVSFADGYPFLLLSEESLQHLNEKLKQPVELDRFRANFIITGAHPHVEDEYQDYQIGAAHFKAVKPCARCTVITVDQKNGAVGKEPLKTLSQYRKTGNKVLFGQNLVLESSEKCTVQIGDIVQGLNKKV